MQAIILAAGKGTRMKELPAETPNPMLLVAGKPVLEYVVESLPEPITEIIFVVGYLQEKIRMHFGNEWHGKKIIYIEQNELNGTGGALWCCKDILSGAFLVLNGDDICEARDIAACAASPDWALLVQQVDEVGSAGKVVLNAGGTIADIQEKEVHGGGSGLANTANMFKLDVRVFSYKPVYRPGSTTEFGLPQTVVQASKIVPIYPIKAHSIVRLTDPQDIPRAEAVLAGRKA